MYKLLVVSDQDEVTDAYGQIHNWEYNGFRRPHFRRDVAGAKEGLQKHHVDGIAMALDPASEAELRAYLQAEYPLLPIFEAGRTPEEALEYLGELNYLLNRIRADFSSDRFNEQEMLIRARRHFYRKILSGEKITCRELQRGIQLRRSRMDPEKPCIIITLERTAPSENRLADDPLNRDHLLERWLFQSFGGDVCGYHVLPLVTKNDEIFVLAGALRDQPETETDVDRATALKDCVEQGLQHAEEYQGLHLKMTGMEILPSMYALCSDYHGT